MRRCQPMVCWASSVPPDAVASVKAVRYLRVSTAAQSKSDRFGFARQIDICERSEDRHGLEAVATTTDTISGGTRERPGLGGLVRAARQSGATAISLSEVDRLSRDITGGHIIIDALVSTGLDIYAYDLRTRVNLRDIESVREINDRLRQAHEERARIRDRTYGGMLAKARGSRRQEAQPPRVLNGYGFRDGAIHEPEARWVRHMYERILDVGSVTILSELNARGVSSPSGRGLWMKGTVLRTLRHPLYKGEYIYGRQGRCTNEMCGEVRHGTHNDAFRGSMTCKRCGSPMTMNQIRVAVPVIVDPDAWDAAQRALRGRRRHPMRPGRRKDTFALQGRARCGLCGGAMSAQTMWSNADLKYYYCRRGLTRPEVDGRLSRCEHRKMYRIEPLHDAVRARLVALAHDEKALVAAVDKSLVDTYASAREAADQERRELRSRLDRLDEAYEAGVMPLDRYAVRRRDLEGSLAVIPDYPPAPSARTDLAAYAHGIREALAAGPLHEVLEAARATVMVFPGAVFNLELAP